jgi:periplasmic protein CpxP/Spy
MKKIRAAAIFCTVLFAIGMFAAQNPGAQTNPGQMGTTQQTTPGQPQMTPPSQQIPSGQAGQGAQTAPQPSQGQSNVDNQVSILSDQLNLTKDQQSKVRSILVDQHEQAMTLVKDNTLSREDKIAKIHSLREGTISKVRGVLTDDQKPKFDAMVQQQDERMRQREQGGPGGDNSNPPSGASPSSAPPAGTPPANNPPGAVRPPQ